MAVYGRLGPDPDKHTFGAFAPSTKAVQLPQNVSYEYLFPPIQDQEQQGTCVTFAVISIVEAILTKRLYPTAAPSLSQAALYAMTKLKREPANMQEQGLYAQDALWVLQNCGYVLSADRPYKNDPNYILEAVPDQIIHTDHELKNFERVGGNELGKDALNLAIQLALFERGPVAIGVEFQLDWENTDATGVLTTDLHRGTAGGHELAVVGYSLRRQAYRVRNSWGPSWADHGYCWLSFDSAHFIDDAYTIGI